MKTRIIWLSGMMAGALVWAGSPELRWPARLFTSILLGPAPAALVVQAAATEALTLPLPRMRIYAGSIAGMSLLGVVALLAATNSDFTPRILGLRSLPASVFALWTTFAILACGAVVIAFKACGFRDSAIMREIVPVARQEKGLFVALSMSAGVGEELTFRSFLLTALWVATGSLLGGVVLSSCAFGLMHAHQRAGGAVRAALLGVILAFPLLVTGSVYPSMAAHAIVDIVGGLWMARWLLR